MSFTIDGIVSGFETSSIIESILGFQQAQIDTFNSRKAEITTEQSAFKGIEAQLLTLQSSLSRLNRTQSSVFDVRAATSTNEEVAQVVAESGTITGSYQITVGALATAHQIGSQGFASTSEQIAEGDITIQVGNRTAQTISIDQSNGTVSGLVETINEQVDDVNASLIYDQGSGAHRILLVSRFTGTSNEISVTTNLSGSGETPDFSGPAIQEAGDASITLGSGPGAITSQFASNQVEDLISGLTIDLKGTSASAITIEVSQDTTPAKEAIEAFVTDFNALMEFITEQTRFIPDNNQASPLLGNRNVSNIRNELLGLVSNTVAGTDGVNRLSQIGVDINAQGLLTIDSNKLDKALSGSLDNVDPRDISKLFGLNASSDNSGISFLTGGTRTQDSTTPYEVDITQAAERATVTATNALAASTVIDGTNDKLQITVDGTVSEEISLTHGTYTMSELASLIQELVNQSSELGNRGVLVSVDGSDQMVISSELYGGDSQISSVSGTASSALGFTGSESDAGQDVAGVFIVNGVEEIAKGTGRVLVGDSDNAFTADLQLKVTLSSSQVVAGVDANVQVTRGVSGQINQYINSITDVETGLLKTVNEDYEGRLSSIDKSIANVERITESRRDYLVREFAALEQIINELQTTGSFISSQLQSIGSFGNNNRNGNN